MAGFLVLLHVLWLPVALALGFLLVRQQPRGSNRKIGLGCLWSFLIYAGGFAGLLVLGLATCKLDFK